MSEEILTDELWARLEPLIPMHPRRFRYPGRRRADDRAALEGILYVVCTGIGWNRLPTALFGVSGATCRRRLTGWHEAGVWQQPHERLRAAALLDLSAAAVDSTHLRALKGRTTPAQPGRPAQARLPAPPDHRRPWHPPLAVPLTGGHRNADRGYDHDKYRRPVRARGITPLIARLGTEHGSGLGTIRWPVEHTFTWLKTSADCASAPDDEPASTKPSSASPAP